MEFVRNQSLCSSSQNHFHINQGDTVVKTHLSLFKDRVFCIHYNREAGLWGSIHTLSGDLFKNASLLPVTGVPKEVLRVSSPKLLKVFFQYTHVLPGKGWNGTYNRLEVHVSGKGGMMKYKIPFQPGLALGSMVRGDVIEKMEKSLASAEKVERLKQRMDHLEKKSESVGREIEVLEAQEQKLEQEDKEKPKAKLNRMLIKFFKRQRESLEDEMKRIPEKLEIVKHSEFPSFSNITTGLTTPIDLDTSKPVEDARGFDSVVFGSQYIDFRESNARIRDKMNQSASAGQLSVSGGFGLFKAEVSHSWAHATVERIAAIRDQGHASKVLVIHAFFTSRYVRRFRNRTYDMSQLRSILNHMRDKDLNLRQMKNLGITVSDRGKKSIYLLTEAVMGGSFSAIVTYLKEDVSARDLENSGKESSSSTQGRASFSLIKGSFDYSRQKAAASHDDRIRSRGNINVTIEFIAQGAIPELARDQVIRSALKHQEMSLGEYHKGGSHPGSNRFKSKHQAETGSMVYKEIDKGNKAGMEKEEIDIHSPSSVLKAYNSFCKKMIHDPKAGVPIGFNYSVLKQSEIESILRKEESKRSRL